MNVEDLKNYLIQEGLAETPKEGEEDDFFFTCTVDIASAIARYAHRNQKRDNGLEYYSHPYMCMRRYQAFVGIANDPFCIDSDLMVRLDLPTFEGIQEVCLMHDVVEDTDVTMDEIKAIFDECGYKTYYTMYIEDALKRITHDKSEPYEVYMQKVIGNPRSAMAKFMDLIDNLNLTGLRQLTTKEARRAKRYINYCKMIEDKYHFLQKIYVYFAIRDKE